MIVLLDTFVVVRALDDSLPEGVKEKIRVADMVVVSAASAWELATKYRIGKFPQVTKQQVVGFPVACLNLGARVIPIEAIDATTAGLFESEHRDPFDRMIGAQGHRLNAQVITPDIAFDTFPDVQRWWLP